MYRSVLWNRIALGALALALTWGCSGSEPTPPAPDPVASVVLFNVPTTPLFAPNGVQLFATALSATGATINGVSLSWKTSDAGIATVSSSGFVTAVGAGVVTITVTGGGKSASATIDVRAGGTLGPAGGTLSVLDGAVIITVPAGALNTTVEFSVRPISDAAVTARIVPGSGFEIVTTPSRPIPLSTLELRFNPAILPAGANEGTLQLYSLVGNAWHVVPGSTVSTSRHSVSGGFQLGATFGAAITSVGSIALDDALRNDALYPGEARQLSTVVRDPEGYILTGRTIAWASSNPAIATVADGTVTATGAGSAIITASGRLVSFDLQRRVLAWELSDEFTGTVAVADDVLYVINGGQFEARRESDGGLLWAWNPPAGLLRPTVIVTRNLVFASSQDTTYALDLSARRKIWQYPAGGDLALSAQGVLVIATPDGWLHAISVR